MLTPKPLKDTIAQSVVKQIIRAAHPFTSRERVSAVVFAYFDESGKPDHSPVVSLGAVVASERKWKDFEKEWMKELYLVKAPIHPRHNLPYFHMTDFESPDCKDYRHLNKDAREAFISSLAGIVNETISYGVVESLAVKDWNEIVMPHFLDSYRQNRGWYLFMLQNALIDIAYWTKNLSLHEPIACIFDTNNEVSYAATEHFNDIRENDYCGIGHRFVSATFANSVQFCPLQAADILAYEGRKDIHNKYIDGGERPIRKLLQVLLKEGRLNISRSNREDLETFRDVFLRPRQ
ncbi:DUF3800 domain-containing protein [Nitrospira sp. T9]